jgi:hypothetical protein
MSVFNYKIQKYKNFTRLNELHTLVKNAYMESGIIPKDFKNNADFYPHLNSIPETTIIVAENENKIVGTISITLDGPEGLHTDKFFKKETDMIRNSGNKIVGSSWRIATSNEYRKNIRLFLDLVQETFFTAKEMNIETCLFVFLKKHEEFYKKLLDAEKINETECNFEDGNMINYVLMKTDTHNSQKHLSKIFTQRKFI